jgi:transcriptional regulator with XRE-family HTH domain
MYNINLQVMPNVKSSRVMPSLTILPTQPMSTSQASSPLTLPSERLSHIIKEMGINYTRLGDLAGVSRQSARAWCLGQTKDLRMEHLFRLQDRTNYSARWIATGEGPEKVYQIDTLTPDEVEIVLAYRAQKKRFLPGPTKVPPASAPSGFTPTSAR